VCLTAKTVCAADITFCRDGTYKVTVGGKMFTVRDVSLVETDNKTILSCDLNGRTTHSNVMFDKDTIHLFTTVRYLLCLLLFVVKSLPCFTEWSMQGVHLCPS